MTKLGSDVLAQIEELGFVPAAASSDPLAELQIQRAEVNKRCDTERDPEALCGILSELARVHEQLGPRLVTGLRVHSEIDTLNSVLIGTANTLLSCPDPQAICNAIGPAVAEGRLELEPLHEYVRHPQDRCNGLHPDDIQIVGAGHVVHQNLVEDLRRKTEEQILALVEVLEQNGVTVLRPFHVNTQKQLFAPDSISVVGDTLIISNMGEPARRLEFQGLEPHFADLARNKIIRLPEGVVLDGRDLMVQEGTVYVGINGTRTSVRAVDFLREHFPDKKIVQIDLATPHSGEDVLHLGCCLGFAGKNREGQNIIVVYEDGIKNISRELNPDVKALFDASDVIRISREEQEKLGTDFLAIGSNKIVSGTDTPEVNAALRARGIEVIELDISLVKLWGGAFRRLSHPISRGVEVSSDILVEQGEVRFDAAVLSPTAGLVPTTVHEGSTSGASWIGSAPNRNTHPDLWDAWNLLEGT